jgi:peptidoglycan/LPS O-acetylase OafA/YrhL
LAAIWDLSSRAKAGIALCLLAALVTLAALSKGNFDQWDGPITLLRCLPEFIFGTLLYCAFRASSPHPWFARDSAAMVVTAAIIVCLHADAPDLLITSLFGAFVLIAVLNTGAFAGWTKAPALIWLGDVSYSLYLLHGFLQFFSGKLLAYFGLHNHADLPVGSSFMLMIAMIGLCLLAAHFTYFGIEIGCRQHLREMLDAQIKKRRAKIDKSAPPTREIGAPAWARSVTFKPKT